MLLHKDTPLVLVVAGIWLLGAGMLSRVAFADPPTDYSEVYELGVQAGKAAVWADCVASGYSITEPRIQDKGGKGVLCTPVTAEQLRQMQTPPPPTDWSPANPNKES